MHFILPADYVNDMKVLSTFPVITKILKKVGILDVHNLSGNWIIDRSVKLLVDLASTVILGFRSCRGP
jgi:hypothetical protein